MHTHKSAPEIVKACAATSKLPQYWKWKSWSQTQPASKFWHSRLKSRQWKEELSHAGEVNSHSAETWKVNVCEEVPQQSQAQHKVPGGWCSWGLKRTWFWAGTLGSQCVYVPLTAQPALWRDGKEELPAQCWRWHYCTCWTVLQDGALSNKGEWINTGRV